MKHAALTVGSALVGAFAGALGIAIWLRWPTDDDLVRDYSYARRRP